ncbi:hypothetical protein [Bacteroides helcogenes]|uniref:hypothetical protein n=1 Tax=Bacteroides helcogenes TaxID=290053 RepID=UPI0002F4B77D|nr:hypothetical protein [Bacteroides helcogenes]MDY5239828.1 hypothetical protein [Bacteroides helcogenes]
MNNLDPSALKENLGKYLSENKEMPVKERERLQKLADGIQENDNNYILYAKLK